MTAPTTQPEPAPVRRPSGPAVAGVGLALGVMALVTAGSWLLFFQGAYLHYDTIYALLWGQELASGTLPNFTVSHAPTPHPLGIFAGALSSLVAGENAYDFMLLATPVSYALLVCAVYLLGARAFDWRVGLLGALIVATSYPVVLRSGASFFDTPAVGLVVLAAALEVERPRRGLPVLALLAVAGLLRPEVWLISLVYLAWLAPAVDRSALVRAALVAAIAPTVWLGMDWVVAGDPLYGFTHTQEQIRDVSNEPGVAGESRSVLPESKGPVQRARDTVTSYGEDLRETLRMPVLLGGLFGLGLALTLPAVRRRSGVLTALLVLGSVNYGLLGLAGLFLMERFAFLAASMLALFCAFAIVGWLGWRPSRLRLAWAAAGTLILLGSLVGAPHHASGLRLLQGDIASRGAISDDLERLVKEPEVVAAFRGCGTIAVQSFRAVPHLAYLIERSPQDITEARGGPPPRGAYVVAATPRVEEQYLRHEAAEDRPLPRPPFPGFREVAANRSFIVMTKGCGPSA